MNKYTYPRPMDMEVFVRWFNGGDSLFLGKERKQTLTSLKDLLVRMDLPPEYESMRRDVIGASQNSVRGPRFGHGPCREFRRGVGDAMRLCGYVYYLAPGAPIMARVPLEPQQIHLLRLLTAGHSTAEVADALGTDNSNVRWRLVTLRRMVGAATTSQLIASVYQQRWLPTAPERMTLIRSGAPAAPGMLTKASS